MTHDVYSAIEKQIWAATNAWFYRHAERPRRIVTHLTIEMWHALLASPMFSLVAIQESCPDMYNGKNPMFAGSEMVRVNRPGLWAITRVIN